MTDLVLMGDDGRKRGVDVRELMGEQLERAEIARQPTLAAIRAKARALRAG